MPTWGTKTTGGTQLTAVDNVTEEFFNIIIATSALETQCEILVNNEAGSVTNGLLVVVYLTQDTTSEDMDDLAFLSDVIFPGSVVEEKKSYKLPACIGFRVGCIATGADDYTVDMWYSLRTA